MQNKLYGVSVGLLGLVCVSTYAQGGAGALAANLKLIGVTKMEIATMYENTTNATYCAIVDVEFANEGKQSVKLQEGTISVSFKRKGHIVTDNSYPRRLPVTPVIISQDGVEKFSDYRLRHDEISTNVPLGVATILNEDADTNRWQTGALIFKAAKTEGTPYKFSAKLFVNIGLVSEEGPRKRIADIANILGNPSDDYIMHLEIQARVAEGFGVNENWAFLPNKSDVELNLTPSVKQTHLFQ